MQASDTCGTEAMVIRAHGLTSQSIEKPSNAGTLLLLSSEQDEVVGTRRLLIGYDLLIGRDKTKCQWVLDDRRLSAKHLRIYTIVFENEEEGYLEYLTYAEDLSRNGTFWNQSLIGKGNGGFLLSDGDKLRLSSKTCLRFLSTTSSPPPEHFDLTQEMEMLCFHDDFIVTDRLLGAGAFGKVFLAVEQSDRTQVACKVVDLRKLSGIKSKHFTANRKPAAASQVDQKVITNKIESWAEGRPKRDFLEEKLKILYREIDILSRLSHPNIIGLSRVWLTDNTIYMFQDLVTAGDLFSYLESKNGRLSEVEAAVIIYQILIAIDFLHGKGIVHRDLKPENIMMTSLATGCRVVLTDFGTARQVKVRCRMTTHVGSEQYTAPEVKTTITKEHLACTGYTKAIYLWSIGAITVVLLTGRSAFSDPSTGLYSPIMARNCDLRVLKETQEWSLLRTRPKGFIKKLLVLDEERRMTAKKALEHAWFSNDAHKTDFEELYQRSIKNWRPRVLKQPVAKFIDTSFVKDFRSSRAVLASQNHSRPEKKAVKNRACAEESTRSNVIGKFSNVEITDLTINDQPQPSRLGASPERRRLKRSFSTTETMQIRRKRQETSTFEELTDN